jgi:hypothetical protein
MGPAGPCNCSIAMDDLICLLKKKCLITSEEALKLINKLN